MLTAMLAVVLLVFGVSCAASTFSLIGDSGQSSELLILSLIAGLRSQ